MLWRYRVPLTTMIVTSYSGSTLDNSSVFTVVNTDSNTDKLFFYPILCKTHHGEIPVQFEYMKTYNKYYMLGILKELKYLKMYSKILFDVDRMHGILQVES